MPRRCGRGALVQIIVAINTLRLTADQLDRFVRGDRDAPFIGSAVTLDETTGIAAGEET